MSSRLGTRFRRRARRIKCATHGSSEWKGTVVCNDCNNRFNLNKTAPNVCACGADLTKTARAICGACFEFR